MPIAAAILLIPRSETSAKLTAILCGIILTLAGEGLRLWGVHHIGVISRTRSDRLGSLVDTGPFAIVRNPLYVANITIWVGFTVAARLLWLAPIVLALLALEYHAIVKWEERLLESRLGEAYREYARRVPRWIPTLRGQTGVRLGSDWGQTPVSWRETLFSERGTLIAIAAGYLLLWIKAGF